MEVIAGNKKHIIAVTVLALLASILLPGQAHASSDVIIINEVFYDSEGTDTGNEWIEIKNISTMELNIGGWKIQTAGTSFQTIYSFPSFLLPAGGIMVIGEQNTQADLITTLEMQNGGSATDGVRIVDFGGRPLDTLLYDEPNLNNLLDDLIEFPEIFAPDVQEGHSLCRISDEDTDSMADFVECDNPSFGEENTFPPVPLIEGPTEAETGEKVLFDALNSYDINGEIVIYSWNILSLGIEKLGKEFEISFDQDGEFTIELSVTDDSGLSAKTDKIIKVTQSEEQQNPPNQTITKSSILEAKLMDNGSLVLIEGVITANQGLLYSREGYIQDESGGIRMKVPEELILETGKNYRFFGERDSTYGEPRISVITAEEIDKKFTVLPVNINTIKSLQENIGNLITISGMIVKKSGNDFYIESDNPEDPFRINLSKYANLSVPSDIKGQIYTVTGIVSQYGTNDDGTPKLKIMPRTESDITQPEVLGEQKQELAVTGVNLIPVLLLSIFIIPIALFYILHPSKNLLS